MLEFPIIDSHIHLLDQKRFGYAWASGAPALQRDFSPDDLFHAAKPYNLEGFVFVEVDVDLPQYLDEADWVDQMAARDPRIKAAVVALPLERGAALEGEIARVAALKTTRGVRRLIQNQSDPEFMLRAPFLEALKLLSKYKLSFDICIFHRQLANTIEMVRRCPEVSFVLDHIGKPGIKAGLMEPWKAEIVELAKCPNVVCKLSGVTTEADHAAWTPEQLRPYVDHVIDRFGIERILYGGDWPVSDLAGSYLQWLTTLEQATTDLTEGERRNLFRDNAKRVYRLKP
jgi:L-fuconolactonase